MFFLLLNFLQNFLHFKIPSAFTYLSTRMILATVTALVVTIFLGPKFIKKLYELKIGQSIRSETEVPLLAQLHEKKQDTPTMGGILILSSMLICLVFWMDLQSVFTWIFIFVTLGLGLVGGFDDYLKLKRKNSKGLSAKKKMIFQLMISFLISAYLVFPFINQNLLPNFIKNPIAKEQTLVCETLGQKKTCQNVVTTYSLSDYITQIYVPFFKDKVFFLDGLLRIFLVLFFMFVITGSSNAVNLTDGLDGLASGCLIMVSTVLAIFAFLSNHLEISRYLHILYIEGSGEIAIYMMALAGSCLGFLWYNSYPAQVFMGDTGSLALGGILAVASVLLRREFILAIAGFVFVVEAISVILQVLSYRYRNKKRVFLCAPLHHHFEYKGWHETKVVIRFWIVGLFFALIAISSIKFQ